MDPRVAEIRSVLDELYRVEDLDNETKEEVYDRELAKIRSLDRENIIGIVKVAVGSDKRRRKHSSFVFAQLFDVPGIESVLIELLESSDAGCRSDIIQTIGLRKMRTLVGVLNDHFVREADDSCRTSLLHTLAKLADNSSLPIFEYLIRRNQPRDEWTLIYAGAQYGKPEFRDYLLSAFQKQDFNNSHRVVAAWGLAKLGEKWAFRFLIEMLDDLDIRTANTFEPGQSIRAAQAIADINGWDFEWHKDSVTLVKQRLAESK